MLRSPGSKGAACLSCTRSETSSLQPCSTRTARSTTTRSHAPGRSHQALPRRGRADALDRDRQRVRHLEQPRHPVPAGRLLLQAREPPGDRPELPARSHERLRAALGRTSTPRSRRHSPTSRSVRTRRAWARSRPPTSPSTTSSRPRPTSRTSSPTTTIPCPARARLRVSRLDVELRGLVRGLGRPAQEHAKVLTAGALLPTSRST